MAENNTANGSKLTTEQLLTELGKLVFTMNKQLVTVNQKLESIDGVLAEGVPQKLDRLAELLEASNGGLEAIKTAIGETTARTDSIDKKTDKVEKAVKTSTDKTVKELKNIVNYSKDLAVILTVFEEKVVTCFTESGKGITANMKTVEEALSDIKSSTYGVLESVKKQTEEAARLAELPPHPDLVTKLDELVSEVRKTSESTTDKITSETSRMIESPPHPDLVSKLDGIGDLVKSSSETVDGDLLRTAEGIVAAINTSDDTRKALLDEKFDTISDRMEIFPDSVSKLGEKLSEKFDDFKEEAGKILEVASTSLEKSSSTLETVEKIVEETKQEQSKALSKMMELVEKHRENADEVEIERLNSQAIHHFNNAEYTLAQDSVEKALMLGANRAELWSNLAHVKAAAEDSTGAEEAFKKALQLEPELDQAVSGLGVLLVDTGRPQETIEFLREFLMEDSPSIRTMMAYAKALSATGRHADALEILNRAKELAPDNPEIDVEIAKYSESGSLNDMKSSVQTSAESFFIGSTTESSPGIDTESSPGIDTESSPGIDTESISETSTEKTTENTIDISKVNIFEDKTENDDTESGS